MSGATGEGIHGEGDLFLAFEQQTGNLMFQVENGVAPSAPATKATRSMREIMKLRDQRQSEVAKHPFFEWFESPELPLEKKFDIMPVLVQFIMNFRDMNLWVIRFSEGAREDIFKSIINGSTTEDETHSRLFLEDWRKFHLDDRLNWAPSDVLWWLFLSKDLEPFREFAAEFMRLCVDDGGDPLVRFAHSEAGEACGNVFFTASAPLAEQLGKERKLNYRYFGQFHLDLETGHVLESEKKFQDAKLTQDQYDLSVSLMERMFKVFHGIYDSFLLYGKRFVDTGEIPKNTHEVSYTDPQNEKTSVETPPSARFLTIHSSQEALEVHLQRRIAQAEEHPFYQWLNSDKLPPIKRLRRFIPLWAFDALAYRDLNKYFFPYAEPKTELEHTVNALGKTLESHSQLFLQDWKQLDLDAVLRWPASESLAFFFLDHVMDAHRQTLVRFGMEVLAHPDPLDRLWFIEALEATGYSFFANTKRVALLAEKEESIRLDYFCDRHASVNPKSKATEFNFKNLEVSDPKRLASIHRLIDLVFDALNENLALSLDSVTRNKLSIR